MLDIDTNKDVATLDAILASHPIYAEPDYLLSEFVETSRRRLQTIAEELEPAQHLLSLIETAPKTLLRNELTDTAVRNAIKHAQARIISQSKRCMTIEDAAAILTASVKRIQDGITTGPYNPEILQRPVNPDFSNTVIWTDTYPDTPHSTTYRNLIKENYGGNLAVLGSEDYARINRALALLNRLVPKLIRSALAHVRVIGIFDPNGAWGTTASSSQIRLGGTIFIGRHLLDDPWKAAEHILHESLHQKLYDFRHGHTLLKPRYDELGGPRVSIPWNAENGTRANSWDAHRVYAAFHVYAQLCLLATAGRIRIDEMRDEFGPNDDMLGERKAFDRAWFLGEKLQETVWSALGEAGRELCLWIIEVLKVLNVSPPPQGARTHLSLVLMDRDTIKLRKELDKNPTAAELETINSIVSREVDVCREALRKCGADTVIEAVDEVLETDIQDDSKAAANRRRLMYHAVQTALGSDTVLDRDYLNYDSADAQICSMILESNRAFFELFEGVPRSVTEARLRASNVGFHASCCDEVGEILATLSAKVPVGGRILEIGTGTGVGLAWIIHSLADRDDVEIVSVELDQDVWAAAQDYSWPASLTLLQGEFLGLRDKLGQYDLVFADASPLKYEKLPEIMDHVAEGGTLVIDDLDPTQFQSPDDAWAKKADQLKRILKTDPSFSTTVLSSGTGILLATRKRAIHKPTDKDDTRIFEEAVAL